MTMFGAQPMHVFNESTESVLREHHQKLIFQILTVSATHATIADVYWLMMRAAEHAAKLAYPKEESKAPLAPTRNNTEDNEPRKQHYGSGEQPWDTILSMEWAADFAAANVIKYLRRSKNPAHSLESARWYFARIKEHCPPLITLLNHVPTTRWEIVYVQLNAILTKEERATLDAS